MRKFSLQETRITDKAVSVLQKEVLKPFPSAVFSQVQLDDDFYSGIENETYPLLVHGPFVSEKALALLNRLVRISFNSKFLRLYVKFKQELSN